MSALNLPSSAFAMEAEALDALLARLNRPLALEAQKATTIDPIRRVEVHGRTAVLQITGPLLKGDSWLARAIGATTYEGVRRRLQAALDHAKVEAIALYVDSPGGEANGCDELARAIFDARGKKPIAAFVSGMAASAAYWIASAAETIVVSDAAMLGSVGIVMQYENHSRRDEQRGLRRFDFVSSQSPAKGFVPDRIQRMVDDMAAVFVTAVATHRGIAESRVLSWQGGIEIGAKGVAAGMADRVGSFEGMLADLARKPMPILAASISAIRPASPQTMRVAAPAAPPALTVAERARVNAKAKAEQSVKERIRAIFNSEPGKRLPERAAHFAYETQIPADAAIAAMKEETIAASWRAAARSIQP